MSMSNSLNTISGFVSENGRHLVSSGGYQRPVYWQIPGDNTVSTRLFSDYKRSKRKRLSLMLSAIYRFFMSVASILILKYPIQLMVKSIKNLFMGKKTKRSAIRLTAGLLLGGTLVAVGLFFFPSLGGVLAGLFGLAFSVSGAHSALALVLYYALEVTGFFVMGMSLGVVISKQAMRFVSWLKTGETNPEKYCLTDEERLRFVTCYNDLYRDLLSEADATIEANKLIDKLLQEIKAKRKSCSHGEFSDIRLYNQYYFYTKKLLKELKNGNVDFVETYLADKKLRKAERIEWLMAKAVTPWQQKSLDYHKRLFSQRDLQLSIDKPTLSDRKHYSLLWKSVKSQQHQYLDDRAMKKVAFAVWKKERSLRALTVK